MLLYLAGNTRTEREKKLVDLGCNNRLLSYWEYREKINQDFMFWYKLVEEGKASLFLDSGAYSAMTSGSSIDIDVYCDFIDLHKHHLSVYACLDVIGDADGTLANYKYMTDVRGLNPLPVFHGGEDYKYLDYYCSKSEYVAVGGVAGIMSNKVQIRAFMEAMFDRHPNTKFHAFGITILDIITEFPFYSCDSTSWLMSGAMGNIFTPWGVVCMSSKSLKDNSHFEYKTPEQKEKITEYFSKYGMTYEGLSEDYNDRLILNAMFMKNYQDEYVCKPRTIKKKKLF